MAKIDKSVKNDTLTIAAVSNATWTGENTVISGLTEL